jgi:hypothetical protein
MLLINQPIFLGGTPLCRGSTIAGIDWKSVGLGPYSSHCPIILNILKFPEKIIDPTEAMVFRVYLLLEGIICMCIYIYTYLKDKCLTFAMQLWGEYWALRIYMHMCKR